MQEMDRVRLIRDREKYAEDGIYKGMYGWICHPKKVNGTWLVNFPEFGAHPDIETISVREEDLVTSKVLDALMTECIRYDRERETMPPDWGTSAGGEDDKTERFFHYVQLAADREKYIKHGVYKGMYGYIGESKSVDGCWSVTFPQCDEHPDIATIYIAEEDLLPANIVDVRVNESIKAEHEAASGDMQDYII